MAVSGQSREQSKGGFPLGIASGMLAGIFYGGALSITSTKKKRTTRHMPWPVMFYGENAFKKTKKGR
jgi:hypothetical protein